MAVQLAMPRLTCPPTSTPWAPSLTRCAAARRPATRWARPPPMPRSTARSVERSGNATLRRVWGAAGAVLADLHQHGRLGRRPARDGRAPRAGPRGAPDRRHDDRRGRHPPALQHRPRLARRRAGSEPEPAPRPVRDSSPGAGTMQPFAYARPATLDEAISLLAEHGPDARVLAGGTDLVIRLRDGTFRPRVVVDVEARAGAGARDPGRRGRRAGHRRDDHDDPAGGPPGDPARPRGARGVGGGRGLGPDPEPGDAGREPVQRLARGGHGAGAAGPRRGGRAPRAGWRAAGPAGRVLRPVRGHDARPRGAHDGDRDPGGRRRASRARTSGGPGGAATTWPR